GRPVAEDNSFLALGPTKGFLQLLPLLLPARVFGLRALFQDGALSLQRACLEVMLPFCLVQGSLRLGDRALPTLPVLGVCGLLLPPLAFTLPLRSFVLNRRLAGGQVVGLDRVQFFRVRTLPFRPAIQVTG